MTDRRAEVDGARTRRRATLPTLPWARPGARSGAVWLLAPLLLAAALGACSDDGDARRAGPTTTAPTTLLARPEGPVPDGPNVVLILLDDLDAVTMPYWEALPKTKRWVAQTGTTFTSAFASSPECCPSRATVLTGDYPHNTGIYDSTPPDGGSDTFASDGTDEDTVATRLHDAGYQTSFVGKYLNGYEELDPVPPGWDRWFGLGRGFSEAFDYAVNHNGRVEDFGDDEDDHLTDVLADTVTEELALTEADDDRPFLLSLWTSAPHADIDAAPRYADHPFADADLPRGPGFDEPDVADKPLWLREGQRRLTDADVEDLTTRYRKMMGSLYAVDDLVDGLFRQLEEQGELDDTVVVFTSDNGYNFGAHRLPHKMAPYEESIRVPFVMTGPGVPVATDDRLVILNDVAPTVLDAAGLEVDDLDGRSLWPAIAEPSAPWRDDFLVEYHGTYHELNTVHTLDDVREALPGRSAQPPDELPLAFVPTFRALRTTRWTYIEWYAGDEHEYELYDLEADPAQLSNLLADPTSAATHAGLVDELQARLEQLATCEAETCRT